jgi:allantoinase
MEEPQACPRRSALGSERVVLPDGVRSAVVVIDGERIADVIPFHGGARNEDDVRGAIAKEFPGRLPADTPLEYLPNLVIAPGLVDTHVHLNEPGHADWEGFETATQAAAAGGVTTLLDMPLNSIPVTTTLAALEKKRAAAAGKSWVNVGFYGGLIPENAGSLEELLEAGVFGIKAFLCHSGLKEFPNASLEDLHRASQCLERFGRPLLAHAELMSAAAQQPQSARRYVEYLSSRPKEWESDAIEALIAFSQSTRCRVHIVHLANSDVLPILQDVKMRGLPITVETCPHYLHFTPNDVPDGATQFKCAPPFRESIHRDRLWEGVRQGVIDTVGSDHSPCPPAMKELQSGDFMAAWGGIASLQLTLPVTWTGAAKNSIGLAQLFARLSTTPACIFGLGPRKGQIAVGSDADLVVWSPESSWTVRASQLYHRHKLTPYDGATLQGKVSRTYVGGRLVYDGKLVLGRPYGELLAA